VVCTGTADTPNQWTPVRILLVSSLYKKRLNVSVIIVLACIQMYIAYVCAVYSMDKLLSWHVYKCTLCMYVLYIAWTNSWVLHMASSIVIMAVNIYPSKDSSPVYSTVLRGVFSNLST